MRAGAESVAILVVLVLVLVLANGVHSQSLYSCWGGCYNDCFILRSEKNQGEKLPCEYQCLKSCNVPSGKDLNLYCQIGCSFKSCIPFSIDGAKMEKCFGWCTNVCNKIVAP